MPVYDSRNEVYVTPYVGSSIKYGFLTNVDLDTQSDCGHVLWTSGQTPSGLVFGANSPKPGRASKRKTSGEYVSSFYSPGSRESLRQKGYTLSSPKRRIASSSTRSVAVYVTISGVNYAWKMPRRLYNRLNAELGVLGIQTANSGTDNLVWGVQRPKPPVATKLSGSDSLSTFVDPQRVDNLPAGWSLTRSAREL